MFSPCELRTAWEPSSLPYDQEPSFLPLYHPYVLNRLSYHETLCSVSVVPLQHRAVMFAVICQAGPPQWVTA